MVLTRKHIRAASRLYMRAWHRLEVTGCENLPLHGPALLLGNHASFLDLPAVMAVVPYEDITFLASARQVRKPVIGQVLRVLEAITVARNGRDISAIRALLQALEQGRVVGVAVEGSISISGRLGRVHPVLAKFLVQADVPLVPLGICGSYDALPPGTLIPRRRRIAIRIGEPLRIPPATPQQVAAARIRAAIAVLLPPEQRPLPDSLSQGSICSHAHDKLSSP